MPQNAVDVPQVVVRIVRVVPRHVLGPLRASADLSPHPKPHSRHGSPYNAAPHFSTTVSLGLYLG